MKNTVVALMPEGGDYASIRQLMEEFSARLYSAKALRIPPHITLVSRFYTDDYEGFKAALRNYCGRSTPIEVRLAGISHFNDNILKIDAERSDELYELHRQTLELAARFRAPRTREALRASAVTEHERALIDKYGSCFVLAQYHPHLTLAGEDVDAEAFRELIAKPVPFEPRTLRINYVTLLQKSEDGIWGIEDRIKLG